VGAVRTGTRAASAVTTVVLGLAIALSSALTAAGPAVAAGGSVTIDPPDNPSAGTVTLTGTVGVSPGETTTVLYVFDATESTEAPAGSDCSGNGAVGPEDDLNTDGSVGDVLDCELSGVVALNASLAGTTGVQAGLVAFANQAATADLDPDPAATATFVPPGYTGGDARPRLESVARSVTRGQIGLYEPKPLGGSGAGTAFNSAVQVALATMSAAPAGPKWIMFLSDGQSPIDDALLQQLTQSGVRLRSFGIGAGATCAHFASLYKMAAATGESCTLASSPASLGAGLSGSQPDSVNGVSVSIKDVSVAADLDAVGGWRATFTLGAGTYNATAKVVLASGTTLTAHRTFTVAASTGGPPPGSVAPGPGALRATEVRVDRPAPSRAVLPSRVTGRVGVPQRGLTVTRKLAGAQVLLQARHAVGDAWTTVDRDRADRHGRFALSWRPKVRQGLLRVALLPHKKYAGSAAAVPQAQLSACKVARHGDGWSVSCLTTAKDGSRARLLRDGLLVDRARVRVGGVRLHGTGSVSAYVIDIAAGSRHIRMDL
jgi:hypothetical protein